MKTYLIAHTNAGGGGVAQRQVKAKSEQIAKDSFRDRYPMREVTTVGILGEAPELEEEQDGA